MLPLIRYGIVRQDLPENWINRVNKTGWSDPRPLIRESELVGEGIPLPITIQEVVSSCSTLRFGGICSCRVSNDGLVYGHCTKGAVMGLTSALNTSLNGLALNEITIDVLGNNIANAGTNGFKASQVLFTTQLARTLSVGSRPSSNNGGTNPRQVGLGASTAANSEGFYPGGSDEQHQHFGLGGSGRGVLCDAGTRWRIIHSKRKFQSEPKIMCCQRRRG